MHRILSGNTKMNLIVLLVMTATLPVMPIFAQNQDDEARIILSWSNLLDSAQNDPALSEKRQVLLEAAEKALGEPLVRRVYTLADVGKHRTFRDGRNDALEEEIRETFALAMSDFGACGVIANELPLLAVAYRLTGDEKYLDRITVQLEEVATWSPLQRPGWTLYTPGNRLPADGKDGNWLATGLGVRGIGDALDILPDGSLDTELRNAVDTLLVKEIESIVDDWNSVRPWFVRSNNPITNQWVLPTEGLVRACLIVGKDNYTEAYELGVANLLKALDAHGPQGEFEEGYGYASFTVTSLLHAAHAMAVQGDTRAVDHPFLQRFPNWLVQHFQPGRMVINCFDAGGAYDKANGSRPLLSLLAVCTGSTTARWALNNYVSGTSDDLAGLAADGMPAIGIEQAPPTYAQFERATRVNWRSNWQENATGVWVRGGHTTDQHDHQDRGHVNFILDGKPVLIEAGTPSYHHKLMMTHYSTAAGHNVLQLGRAFPEKLMDTGRYLEMPGWQKHGTVAPISVEQLDEHGGNVTVEINNGYDNLKHWTRKVEWGAETLSVYDEVALQQNEEQEILFRWHLGTEDAVDVAMSEEAKTGRVTWNNILLNIEADTPISIEQASMPDHTLTGHDGSEDPKNFHTCLVVTTLSKMNKATFTTRVQYE